MPLALIVNPNCKSNRRDPARVARMRRLVGNEGHYFATQDEEELEEAARTCARNGVDLVGINGGDGSLHLTLTKLIRAYEAHEQAPLPSVIFLRGGTQNTVANSCRVFGQPERVLGQILEQRRLDQPLVEIERDIIRVGDQYGFIFGNGFVHQFLAEYYNMGDPSEWNALKTLVVGCSSVAVRGPMSKRMFRRFHGRVIIDDEPWPSNDYTGIVGSTIEQVGLGFRPFVRCEERPFSFHMLGILVGALGFALELPKIRMGMPLNEKKILSAVCQKVVFESEERLRYIVDGDIYEGGHRLELGVGPRLRIVVPGPLASVNGVGGT